MQLNIDKKIIVLGIILAVVLAALGITAILTRDKRAANNTTTTKNRYFDATYSIKTYTSDTSNKTSEKTETTETTEKVTEKVETTETNTTQTVTVPKTQATTSKKVETIYIDANQTYDSFYLSDDSKSGFPEEIIFIPKEGTILRKQTITSSTTRPKSVVCAPNDNGYHCYLTGLNVSLGVGINYGTNENNLKTFNVEKLF